MKGSRWIPGPGGRQCSTENGGENIGFGGSKKVTFFLPVLGPCIGEGKSSEEEPGETGGSLWVQRLKSLGLGLSS